MKHREGLEIKSFQLYCCYRVTLSIRAVRLKINMIMFIYIYMTYKNNKRIDLEVTNSFIHSSIEQVLIKLSPLARPSSRSWDFNSNYEEICYPRGVYTIVDEQTSITTQINVWLQVVLNVMKEQDTPFKRGPGLSLAGQRSLSRGSVICAKSRND